MLELIGYVLLALVLGVGLFLIASRFLPAGEQIAPPVRDEPVWTLPAGRPLDPAEIDAVRLPVALRGYRFAETDILLDRLATELRARDAEIERLRAVDTAGAAGEPVADGPVADVSDAEGPAGPDAEGPAEAEVGAGDERGD